MLEIEFDPIYIALAWDNELPETLTLDRTELHDLTGRHMWNGLEGALPAGTYRFEVPTAQLAQGNYLLVVEADGRRSATQLMVK